ncbi:conserved hypothetical protein [Mucor ambiguus]|uniref:Uncharacterized protein n=1 Tax=Mucor ambiguus TaxID=91626 RepID=A0A0C9LZ83_9FUNG|nr:conserved hypothetical protein [Mucor ambiguus]
MNSGIVGTFIEPPVIAIATPNSVTCPHCGREEHLRRSHSNCAINFTAQNRVSYLNIARDPALPKLQRNNVGSMDVIICSSCRAHMWMSERKSNTSMATPVFQAYCATGQAILRQLAPLPEQIVNLLKNNDSESKQFKENIRSYNSALSFASMNADLDRWYANNQHEVYAFRIHDGVCYLISSALIPENNNAVQQPRFAQIYIFDS